MRVELNHSEAKGRNGYFHADHACVESVPRPGADGEVWVEVFSKRVPRSTAPCRLILNPGDAERVALAILEAAKTLSLKGPANPDGRPEVHQDQTGGVAASNGLARIAAVMSGTEWSGETLDEIAAIVRADGHEVNDVAEEVAHV